MCVHKIRVLVEVGDVRARVAAHRTDPTLLVLKIRSELAAQSVCSALGIEAGPTWRGSTYFITSIPKGAFLDRLPQGLSAVLAQPSVEPELC